MMNWRITEWFLKGSVFLNVISKEAFFDIPYKKKLFLYLTLLKEALSLMFIFNDHKDF